MSATITAPRGTRGRSTPAVRVVPVPRSEPPTDDERDTTGASAPPMTALLLPLDLATGAQVRRNRTRVAGRWDRERVLRPGANGCEGPADGGAGRRVVTTGPGASGPGTDDADGDRVGTEPIDPGRLDPDSSDHGDDDVVWARGAARTLTAADAEAERAVAAAELRTATRVFLGTCVEVLGGYRPLAQLRPLCQVERFDAIVNRLVRPGGGALGRGHAATRTSLVAGHGTARPGRPTPTGPGERVAVRRVQLCDVLDGVAEVAVVMARRDKVWAMAVRLEHIGGRWLCTHLEVV